MKTLIFIVLKVLELIGVVAIYCGFAYLGYWLDHHIALPGQEWMWYNPLYFIVGIGAPSFIIILIMLVIFGIIKVIKLNKQWSESIYKKLKR